MAPGIREHCTCWPDLPLPESVPEDSRTKSLPFPTAGKAVGRGAGRQLAIFQLRLRLFAVRRKKPVRQWRLGVAGAQKLPIVLTKKIEQTTAALSTVQMMEGALCEEIYARVRRS